jgi:uncharacterized protein with von Willebrand factor type A (vWA) domain
MNSQPKKKASLADTKRALHEMMQRQGLVFPKSPDEIDRLESMIDDSQAPTPDVNAFKRFLRGETVQPAPQAAKILPFDTAAHREDHAMAARNGATIDPAIRQRMDEHRAAAEKSKRKTQ